MLVQQDLVTFRKYMILGEAGMGSGEGREGGQVGEMLLLTDLLFIHPDLCLG